MPLENIATLKAPVIKITGEGDRVLLTLVRVDGRLVAEYNEADLDEAARRFVKAVERHS